VIYDLVVGRLQKKIAKEDRKKKKIAK